MTPPVTLDTITNTLHSDARDVKGAARYHVGMEEPQRFGAWLRKARLAAGLTQQELAERVGIDRTYLVRIETGGIKQPGLELRQKIRSVLTGSRSDREDDGSPEGGTEAPVSETFEFVVNQNLEFNFSDLDDDAMRRELFSLIEKLPRDRMESVFMLASMLTSIGRNLPHVEFTLRRHRANNPLEEVWDHVDPETGTQAKIRSLTVRPAESEPDEADVEDDPQDKRPTALPNG